MLPFIEKIIERQISDKHYNANDIKKLMNGKIHKLASVCPVNLCETYRPFQICVILD
jgi:hypothetical protein